MNSFSNMEISDLLSNRLRLEDRHTPNYLAECFQRLFPTLGRMGLSTVIDEMARANHRAFNSSSLPIRGETLSLGFFFDLWKRGFRFEGGIYDKFVFSEELRLAFKINSREFWEVLVRADRDMGNYLKDSIELLKYHSLPQAISLNLRPSGGFSTDDKTIRLLREKLPFSRDNFTTHEIAKICLQLFEVANPADYDVRRLAEELEKENGIRRLSGSASAIHGCADTSASVPREFTAIIPKKALDRLSTKCVLEFFKNKPLASAEASAMEKGVYTVTEADILLASQQGSDAFWQSIIPDSQERAYKLKSWRLIGLDTDIRKAATGQKILIIGKKNIDTAIAKNKNDVLLLCRLCHGALSSKEVEETIGLLYLCADFYENMGDINLDRQIMLELKEALEEK